MLAFNENGKLTEYEETNFLKVCDSCHHIYKIILFYIRNKESH